MPPARGALRSRFLAITRPVFQSEIRWRALALLALIITLLLGLNGLNVAGSFMFRDFTTAVSERQAHEAVISALLWAAVFGALTVVAVIKAFTEERLRLYWRQWLTRHLYRRYLSGRAYYWMRGRTEVDNPDQRMSEDVRTFTDQTLALFLIIANSTLTLLSFSGVLWLITPWLCLAAVLYAIFGSFMTVLLGRRLIKYDVVQYRKEADLRYDLIQVRTHAEPVALLGGEREEGTRLGQRLVAVVENMKRISGLSRNISFFTTGFDYLIQLIPLLIVAPLYIRGQAEFGMMFQAQVAFIQVMGAFSLIVKEFQRISTFGAVVERLGTFWEVLGDETPPHKSPIEIVEDGTRVAFEGLTLTTPREGRLLIKDLRAQLCSGHRLLVVGRSGSGRTCLLRAAAGLWTSGQGRVVRPPLAELAFLPQQPYLRSGRLRDQLLYGVRGTAPSDERLLAVLCEVRLETVLERVGGLDTEHDWAGTLSQGEQQQVAFARLLLARPRFAFLDEAASALDEQRARHLYAVLARSAITYLSVASDGRLREYHDEVVKLGRDGAWATSEPELACA
jgi:putative ATP-binding cassette transporter